MKHMNNLLIFANQLKMKKILILNELEMIMEENLKIINLINFVQKIDIDMKFLILEHFNKMKLQKGKKNLLEAVRKILNEYKLPNYF